MFSDKFASLFHLSTLRKKLQIPCKGHQNRGCRFFSSSSQMRATLKDKPTITQPTNLEQLDPKTVQKGVCFEISSKNASEVASKLKTAAFGCPRDVPGGSRELPESSPSDPGASPGGLRSTPGAPPERPTRPTELRRAPNNPLGAQKASSGGLRHLILEAFGPSWWSLPQLDKIV